MVVENENVILQNEEKFRNIFDHSTVSMSLTSPDGQLHVNQAFADMLGYTKEELLLNWKSVSHPDDVAETQKIVSALTNGEISEAKFRKRYCHRDGRIIWATVSTYLQRKPDGKPDYFITSVIDISQETLYQQQLQESNQYLESLIKYANAPIIVWDSDFRITRYNPAFALLTGISCEEIIGKHITVLFPPEKADKYMELIKRTSAGERWEVVEIDIVHKNKEVRTLLWNSATMYGADGQTPIAAIAQGTEVTDRIKALKEIQRINESLEHRVMERTKELTKSKMLLEETGRLAKVGGWEYNLLTNTLSWTEMVYQIHEAEPDFQPTLEGGINFYAPESIPAITEAVNLCFSEGKPFDLELQIITVKKNKIWVRAIGKAYQNKGVTEIISGVFQEINERKLAENELRKNRDMLFAANKELEAFTYSVSHDLRAPLRHISGYIELFNKNFRANLTEKGIHYLDVISESALQMGRLIDDLLALSRTGNLVINPVEFAMDEVVMDVIKSLAVDIESREIVWKIDSLPKVRGDLEMIKLTWTNLILNAVKFTVFKKPAIIEIGYHEQPDKYEFYIKDNGVGFDMKYADKLFGVFQRLHQVADFEGTGIGLANVRRIISKHGGLSWAYAELDKGATFSFTLNR